MNFQVILGLVVIVGLVWFMTRRGAQGGGGCCGGGHGSQEGQTGHAGGGCHDSHGGQETKRAETHAGHHAADAGETAVDPVCGMIVYKAKALHANVDGQDYYFCNEACRKEFTQGRQADGGHAGHH